MIMRPKAQALMDYAALIAIVAVSLMIMSSYLYNSIDSRVGHIWADLYDPVKGVR